MSTAQHKPKSHGGYRNLASYQTTTIIYDLTVEFVKTYVSKFSRTTDQMIQAARSGRQNIAEGSQASGTSKKTEIKLVGVARASLEELLNDYLDFLRQRHLSLWPKDSPQAKVVRALAYKSNRSLGPHPASRERTASSAYETYKSYLKDPETAANCVVCLIHQSNFLLDRQLASREQDFIEKGGYTENLFKKRLESRNTTNKSNMSN